MTDDFLQERHAMYQTPQETLNQVVSEMTGQTALGHEPVVRGYANEVYRVRTDGPEPLIVRIQRHGPVGFLQEAWAMARCRAVGIPVPHVYGVTSIGEGDEWRDVMVVQNVVGRELSRVLPDLSPSQCAHVFAQVGAALRAMHDIPVDAFGPLRPEGSGGARGWRGHAAEIVGDRGKDSAAARQAGLTEGEVSDLLTIIETLPDFPCDHAVLCHGDLSADHLFVDERLDLTGIIDFGMCQGGPGILDMAVLKMFHPEIQWRWLAQGYGAAAEPDAETRRQILAHQVNISIAYLAHDTRQGNDDSREIVLQHLRACRGAWQRLHQAR